MKMFLFLSDLKADADAPLTNAFKNVSGKFKSI
jgi:hypothetical protein